MAQPHDHEVDEAMVLGVDPGLRVTGYAVLRCAARAAVLCEGGVLRSRASQSLDLRIAEIIRGLQEVIRHFRPQVMALEQLFSATRFPRTALVMAHVRGAICLAAAQAEIPVVHYAPTRIKKLLTGNGRAPKAQMQHAVRTHLRLDRVPEPPDVADAIAIALCHHHATHPAGGVGALSSLSQHAFRLRGGRGVAP